MDHVLAFTTPRLSRWVFGVKGVAGFARPAIQRSRGKPLSLAGVDSVKSQIVARLAREQSIRFSRTLEPTTGIGAARRPMSRGRPVARFERKPGAKAESLGWLVCGLAAITALSLNAAAFNQRADELRSPVPIAPPPAVIRSRQMERRT